MKYKPITITFLDNHRKLESNGSFKYSKIFTIYKYRTKVEFIYEKNNMPVTCYLYQSNDRSYGLNNKIFLGIVRTEDELNKLLNSLLRTD